MPVRLLKPGIRTSEKWNSCSWLAQSAYIRLITIVDDYGRYLANPKLLRSELFPLGDPRGNDIPTAEVETALFDLSHSKLIELYEDESKSYLQILNWKERVRADSSKYPAPNDSQVTVTGRAKASQLLASPPQPQPTPQPSPTPSPTPQPTSYTTFDAQKIANRIAENDWWWDNCKVPQLTVNDVKGLATVIKPFLRKGQQAIYNAWIEAVRRGHGAKTDPTLAVQGPLAYTIACFKEQLAECDV